MPLREYLSSLELKNAIIHFDAFKDLAYNMHRANDTVTRVYTTITGCAQTQPTKDFFKMIYDANDEFWYLDLLNERDPLNQYLRAPASSAMSSITWGFIPPRKDEVTALLVQKFTAELNAHLRQVLQCDQRVLDEQIDAIRTYGYRYRDIPA